MPLTTLHAISSMATRAVLAELLQGYQRAGRQVRLESAGGIDVAKRVEAGEDFDVVVLASSAIDKLIASGRLLSSRVDIVKSGVAAAVRAGMAKPAFADEDAVKRAVRLARTLSYSTGPSGQHLEKLFAGWGILEEIKHRIVVAPPGRPVAALIADGTVDLGFQQLSELLNEPGIDIIGPLPCALQIITIFSGAISVRCRDPEAAAALLQYLSSPDADSIKRRCGMESADPAAA